MPLLYFAVEPIEDSHDALVYCPACENGVIVNLAVFVEGVNASKGGPARPCTYCCRSAVIPSPENYVVRDAEEEADGTD